MSDPSEDPESWRKSSYSDMGQCVEVRHTGSAVLVRNSTDRSGPVVAFTFGEWAAFVAGIKDGEFDAPPAG